MIQKYKKKPIEVSATQLSYARINDFRQDAYDLIDCGGDESSVQIFFERDGNSQVVKVVNGDCSLVLKEGDYLVRGVDGSIYPVTRSTFEKVYEMPDYCVGNVITW